MPKSASLGGGAVTSCDRTGPPWFLSISAKMMPSFRSARSLMAAKSTGQRLPAHHAEAVRVSAAPHPRLASASSRCDPQRTGVREPAGRTAAGNHRRVWGSGWEASRAAVVPVVARRPSGPRSCPSARLGSLQRPSREVLEQRPMLRVGGVERQKPGMLGVANRQHMRVAGPPPPPLALVAAPPLDASAAL